MHIKVKSYIHNLAKSLSNFACGISPGLESPDVLCGFSLTGGVTYRAAGRSDARRDARGGGFGGNGGGTKSQRIHSPAALSNATIMQGRRSLSRSGALTIISERGLPYMTSSE